MKKKQKPAVIDVPQRESQILRKARSILRREGYKMGVNPLKKNAVTSSINA